MTKITQEEINMLERAHVLYIRSLGREGQRGDLRGLDLLGLSLCGLNLMDANLTGSDLSNCNLEGTNLIGCCLRGANLTGVNISSANVVKADFSYAQGLSRTDVEMLFNKGAYVDSLRDIKDIMGIQGKQEQKAESAGYWKRLKLDDNKDLNTNNVFYKRFYRLSNNYYFGDENVSFDEAENYNNLIPGVMGHVKIIITNDDFEIEKI